ncbi:M15 family metallopeptidase [Psychrobacter frigidicola]|uniref:D-alanyl-D-alanine dipeptidase n=1 Tax=Psychrobacter frigidicola TaxID=45611 RepID=A0A5C6ZYQ8_9GAMM|nr:M15 family metallopeptidase [Psychrobacter frigidicola]TXD96213.1 M15 family metallopeptidase [Psychrobacter frigidicola]
MLLSPIPTQAPHSWKHIENISIIESNEPLQTVPYTENLKQLPFYFDQDIPHAINICVARRSVIQKLQQAANLLPDHLGIVVLDAWRSRAVQQAVQDEVGNIIKIKYPHLTSSEQQQLLLQFVAPVSPDFISPHLTGGSVDITLFERATDKWLDMGSDFDEPTERSYTHFYENQPEHPACNNRRLLYSVMTQVGFSNLPTEWWHFDYGNPLWAYYNQQDNAIYGAAHWDINSH